VRDDLTENTRTVNRTVEDIITEARAPAQTPPQTPPRDRPQAPDGARSRARALRAPPRTEAGGAAFCAQVSVMASIGSHPSIVRFVGARCPAPAFQHPPPVLGRVGRGDPRLDPTTLPPRPRALLAE